MIKTHGSAGTLESTEDVQNPIVCYSLIDITKTGIVSNFKPSAPDFIDDANQVIDDEISWSRSRNQQRNFETIIQTIGLKSQITHLQVPIDNLVDLQELGCFGKSFKGKRKVWTFTFAVEHIDVYKKDGESLLLLPADVNLIPCILDLTETAKIKYPIFQSFGNNKNIHFEEILQ